jgi:CubicO group peptidase (beta-lactamase class C family)
MTARDVRRCDRIRAGGTAEGKIRMWRCLEIAALFLSLPGLVVCTTKESEKDEPFSYQPLVLADWNVSTPEAQGLDPALVLSAYQRAVTLTNIYSLLVVKNGFLVAEKYFHGQAHNIANPTASVTKSIVSCLTGIALRENILAGLDQTITGFFPEVDWPALDSRKSRITIRQILQMRSGFPWEEFTGHLDRLFSSSNWIPFIAEFPLSADPGTQFGYSNLTAHLMAIILARAANASLVSFARDRLFGPLDIHPGYWPTDAQGYNYGSGDLALTPRDMAKFGLMVLNSGQFNGSQVIPADWVSESLTPASFNVYARGGAYLDGKILSSFDVLDYGYLWWSSKAGDHPFHYAWGHGGQLIVLVHDLDMVVVTSANNLAGQFGAAAWGKEKVIMEMVGEFIASL